MSLIPEKAKELFEKYDMHHIGIVNELDRILREGKIIKYSILNNSIYVYSSNYSNYCDEWHPIRYKSWDIERAYRREK